MALVSVLQALSIHPSHSTLSHLAQRDRARNHKRDSAILESQKRRRRQLDSRKLAAESSRRRREKSSKYSSGEFGIESNDLGDVCYQCQLEDCPIGSKQKNDGWVGCDLCEQWYHGRCVGVKDVKLLGDEPYFCPTCIDSVS